MQGTTLVLILAGMAAAAFYLGRARSLAIAGGPSGNVLQLAPPLVISTSQLDFALAVLARAVAAEGA